MITVLSCLFLLQLTFPTQLAFSYLTMQHSDWFFIKKIHIVQQKGTIVICLVLGMMVDVHYCPLQYEIMEQLHLFGVQSLQDDVQWAEKTLTGQNVVKDQILPFHIQIY